MTGLIRLYDEYASFQIVTPPQLPCGNQTLFNTTQIALYDQVHDEYLIGLTSKVPPLRRLDFKTSPLRVLGLSELRPQSPRPTSLRTTSYPQLRSVHPVIKPISLRLNYNEQQRQSREHIFMSPTYKPAEAHKAHQLCQLPQMVPNPATLS